MPNLLINPWSGVISTKTLSKSEIFVTSDLKQFKHITGNRHINRDHLLSIKRSIQRKNLLAYEPILVDPNLGIIDGQHRLEAAKQLELEIYYMIVPDAHFEDVTLLNSNLKNWTMEDYLTAWIERGNEEYINVKKFAKQYGLTLSNAVAILNIDGSKRSLGAPYRIFKAGDFTIKDIGLAHEFAQFWRKMQVYATPPVRTDREFIRALYYIFTNENADKEKLLSIFEETSQSIIYEASLIDYLRDLEDVYNRSVKHVANKTRFY